MPIVREDDLRRLAHDIAAATGIPGDDARIISDHYVDSNLLGHDSHGVWFLARGARGLKDRYVKWEEHEVVRENPCLTIIDGKGSNGIVAVTRSVDLAVEKARQATFGFVGLRNIGHIGRLGTFPPMIADQGMIGMVWLNGGGLFMAPHGSADRRLRPEPIAFSAPRGNGRPPFMLDMTMTTVAGGKIEQKIVRDDPLPDGWLIDHDGKYVNDHRRYRDEEDTAVPPLGGLDFGHKGYGLAMMVEMIVGPLTGAGCTDGAQGGGGVMVLAIDIEAFTDLTTYADQVEALASWVCSARPLPGVEQVYAPGEPEEATKKRRLEEGIEIPDETWKELVDVAVEFGVTI
jgi:uncharacterized oxidoreductase